MKKAALLLLISMTLGFGWWNKRSLFWLYRSMRDRPAKLDFTEFRKDRVRILYVKSPYLAEKVTGIAERVLKDLAQAEQVTGASLDQLTLRLYNNYEEKGGDARDIQVAHSDPDSGVLFCIVNRDLDGTRERLEYELLLQKCCGKPFAPERGRIAAAALGGVWNQKSLGDWRAFLSSRFLRPVSDFARETSPFIRIPWNAVRMQFLYESYDWKALTEFYKSDVRPPDFDARWRAELETDKPSLQQASYKAAPLEFQKGISYAYENSYSDGYPTRKSEASLELLKRNHVEWIASIPYGYMRTPDSTAIGYAGHSIFAESDESVFALASQARSRGMKVMLKPQLWVTSSAWTGMIDFKDDASWNQWFLNYENWILHYAIIAELTRADLFCIGTEMVKTTLKNPARWRKIIARIRQVYRGPLVYAANYGPEFENLQFWDALDYIGLDNYYSVRSDTGQGIHEMEAAFARQKERVRGIAQKWKRPLIFTEIGYQANPGAGMGSRENEIAGYDEAMQAACYRMALKTYWDEPWFYGMYWWKWFSTPDDRGKDADPHSPHGRLAEQVLAEWYAKPGPR